MRSSRIFITCLSFLLLSSMATAAKPEEKLGSTVDNFTLKDYRGKVWSLSDFKDKKVIVLAILGTECPLAKLYGPRLAKTAKEVEGKDVAFIGLNANRQDSITEIAAHARIHQIEFPVLKDLGNKVVDQLGAVRTPEVYVLDQERKIRYRGRIDDQYGVGYIRDNAQKHYLKNAIDQVLNGKEVSRPYVEATGCFIGRAKKPNEKSKVTYSNQIARILQSNCVECHREGEIAPFALTSYKEVAGWGETIVEVIEDQRMPPWHADPKHGSFLNERRLTKEEKSLIQEWVANGCPEGDPNNLPESRTYTKGWQLPAKPDAVFPISEQPIRVQAEGAVRYKYYRVPTNFKEDKWFKAAEILPGNRAVVHHILAFAIPPGGRRGGADGRQGYLVGYVPGLRITPFPKGMAKKIPAGSTLLFQVHYTPIGTVQHDQSKIGFVFADPKEVTHEVKTASAVWPFIRIPPRVNNHRITARSFRPLPESQLLSMMPHMHVRGKSFSYEAQYPNGKTEMLLNVPAYDFNWQTAYRLAEPKPLPQGTRIRCVAHYDNSEENLNNPDPNKTVRWGDQTWNEMLIGYFDIAVPLKPQEQEKPNVNNQAIERARQILGLLDRDGDGKVKKSEVPERFHRSFDRMDLNKDDIITLEELQKLRRR